METLIPQWILHNWQRKAVALLASIVIWIFVSHTITTTKTLVGVPVRVIHLPQDKTIQGIFPNGMLNKRITLSINGTKGIIDHLEPSDIEVVLDASTAPSEWIIHIGKKNLVSLNPNIDLNYHVNQISTAEFVLKLSQLMTEKISVVIHAPKGNPPVGYDFLGVWPKVLLQSVTGPREIVDTLRSEGLSLTFNLSTITKEELDTLEGHKEGVFRDVVSYFVPESWKQISIPSLNKEGIALNDSEAQGLHIDFLKQEFIPVDVLIPVQVYYPINGSEKVNPETYRLKKNELIQKKNNIRFLSLPVQFYGISHLFYHLVKDNLNLSIVVSPYHPQNFLWSIEVINWQYLEKIFLSEWLHHYGTQKKEMMDEDQKENVQKMFLMYMRNLKLYTQSKEELRLNIQMDNSEIVVKVD